MQDESKRCGITVDKVISVETLSTRQFTESDEKLLGINNQNLITSIGENTNNESFILMLDDQSILNGNVK